jgi:hypothetical protein
MAPVTPINKVHEEKDFMSQLIKKLKSVFVVVIVPLSWYFMLSLCASGWFKRDTVYVFFILHPIDTMVQEVLLRRNAEQVAKSSHEL